MKLINLLAGLVGGKIQLVLLVGGILAFGWWHLHATAVAYSAGAKAGKESTLKDQAKEIDRRVAEQTAQVALERVELEAQRTALAGERNALVSQRRAISDALSLGIAKLSAQDSTLRNEITDLPDSAVVARYRLALQRARAAEATRAPTQP